MSPGKARAVPTAAGRSWSGRPTCGGVGGVQQDVEFEGDVCSSDGLRQAVLDGGIGDSARWCIFNGEEGVSAWSSTAASSTSDLDILCNSMHDFFQVFFSESSSLVWGGEVAALFLCRSNVLSALSLFLGVLITSEGCVELWLQLFSKEPVGLVFRWIRLDSTGVRGLRSFYRPLSTSTSLGRRFAS